MNLVDGQGYTDFIMMPEVTEEAFIENLQLRFKQKQIYTYIGEQVVAMNPFQSMNLYTREMLMKYRNRYMYEEQPHIFALAEDTFRALLGTLVDQCVVITGESGAGKTEASKIFMQYLTFISAARGNSENIKKRLLESNPVLEAFGNAKTLRNDNSSRFGKYMEVQFDGGGSPLGGQITQYLLEKSRVVTRAQGERSFHIFYQLLSNKAITKTLGLVNDPSQYNYLALSGCYKVDRVDDSHEFKDVQSAMTELQFKPKEMDAVWRILAAILHLGNVEFKDKQAKNTNGSQITNPDLIPQIADLMKVDENLLSESLTSRSLSTGVGKKKSTIQVFLDASQAAFGRDSLAKAMYDKLFSWVVKVINKSVQADGKPDVVVGVLDIYGFEIFEINSFEQFCINYCNEKLQQLFIHKVLKAEQEEYLREGIKWKEIDYFDNKPIVDLIESKMGMFKTMDDACSVGQATPMDLLNKFDQTFGKHPHYSSNITGKDKTIARNAFRVKHYAGLVDYTVDEFMYKNNDTLFQSTVELVQSSGEALMTAMFPPQPELNNKRPETAGTQFMKNIQVLVNRLDQCAPHYIRCIKSNDKKAAFSFNEERCTHQIRYLNLTETVRVRKAGFCQKYAYIAFFNRYKICCEETYPHFKGKLDKGVAAILKALKIKKNEYEMGKTKLFVKDATTLFELEKQRAKHLPKVAITLQRVARGYLARKYIREHRKEIELGKSQARIVRFYRNYQAKKYCKKLVKLYKKAKQEPDYGKSISMPKAPKILKKFKTRVEKIYHQWWAGQMVLSLSEAGRGVMRQKIQCLDLFKGNKPWDSRRPFQADYLNQQANPHQALYIKSIEQMFQKFGDTEILFADDVVKVNPKLKSQVRTVIVTDKNIYKYDPKKYTMKKVGSPLSSLREIRLSRGNPDYFAILAMDAPVRDMVLDLGTHRAERLSELVAVLTMQKHRLTGDDLPVVFSDGPIRFNNSRAEDGSKPGDDITLSFSNNPNPGKEPCCILKSGGKGQASVLYSGRNDEYKQ